MDETQIEPAFVESIRAASRRLVRELGFMNRSLAGTGLPPSAVHALIEIDRSPGLAAGELASILRLEKSSVSRMLGKLVQSGDVTEQASAQDGRAKRLFLSAKGQRRVQDIHAFAGKQVSEALARLDPAQRHVVRDGLELYADALVAGETLPPPIEIVFGYRVGAVADITGMHARYYAREAGFGQAFESVVAGGLAEFCGRLENPLNRLWTVTCGGRICASIAIDGEDLGPGIAHLRWFIVDDNLRGAGAGRKLLEAALAFADSQGFRETHLWTFAGLDAARHLYEANGFRLAQESVGGQWGREMPEQRFVRPKP